MNNYEKALKKIEQDSKCKPTSIIGPRGPTGPTGPTTLISFKGIQLQNVFEGYSFITPNHNIVFNTIINQNSPNINYNKTNGEITFTKNGTYYVSWWVVVDGSTGTTKITFGFSDGIQTIESSSPLVTGQLTGNALVIVNNAPEIWGLKNTTTDDIGLSDMLVHANITIVESN